MGTYELKKNFILDYIKIQKSVDACDRDFTDDYIETFKVKYKPSNYGAHRVPDASKTLKRMYDEGILKRATMGLQGYSGMGFPKWVWSYYLPTNAAQGE